MATIVARIPPGSEHLVASGETMFPELWTIPILNYPIKSYGTMLMIGFFTATFLTARRAQKVKANPDVLLNCAILALVGSMIGARMFYVIHYWDTRFTGPGNPLLAIIDISKGGMEFYGGIAGAIVPIIIYLSVKRESIRLYFDIMTPGLMWGLAITRIGCFLNGCCWGAVCAGTPAEHWSVQFPYGSPAYYRQYQNGQLDVPPELLQPKPANGHALPLMRNSPKLESPELVDLVRESNSLPVHPAQLYASVNALLASLFLSLMFRVRKRHGMVFAVWLLTYPWTRMILERIRIDNPLDTFGMTVSSAVSIGMIAVGVLLAIYFSRLPLRSPYAKAWQPPPEPAPVRKSKKRSRK